MLGCCSKFTFFIYHFMFWIRNGTVASIFINNRWVLVDLKNPNSDMVTLGDANLNALRWDDDKFEHKEMSNQVREYLADAFSF